MASLFHIGEVAVLLLLAYAVGWAIGYGARRLTGREPKPAEVPAEGLAAATGLAVAASAPAAVQVVATPDAPMATPTEAAPAAAAVAVSAETSPVVAEAPPFDFGPAPEPATAAEALQMLSAQQPLAAPPAAAPLMDAAATTAVSIAPVAIDATASEQGIELKPETMAAVSEIVRSLETAQAPEGVAASTAEAVQPPPAEATAPDMVSEIFVERPAEIMPVVVEQSIPDVEPVAMSALSVEPPQGSPTIVEQTAAAVEEPRSIEPPTPPEAMAAPPASVETAEITAIPIEELASLTPAREPAAVEIPAISIEELAALLPEPAQRRAPAAAFQFDLESLPVVEEAPVLPPATLPEADQPDLFAIAPAAPASRPGVAWAGEINGHRASRYDPRDAATTLVTPSAPVAESAQPKPPAIEPPPVDAALWASVADSLSAVPEPVADGLPTTTPAAEPAPAQRPAFEPVAEAVRQAQAAVEQALAQAFPTPVPEPVQAVVVEPAATPDAPAASVGKVEDNLPPIVIPILESPAFVIAEAAMAVPVEAEPPVPEPIPAAEAIPAPAVAPATPPQAPQPVFDEDAAMRAIEGGWSRRASRALPDKPELTDVSAAVSAAQVAVEQVLVQTGGDVTSPDVRSASGKPKGMPRPRESVRDNLKLINGLGPLDEAALNNLGIYLFEQVVAWDQMEVLWLENHAFARGRIGREDWQEQARRLVAKRDTLRATR